jgi:hypothetical protein
MIQSYLAARTIQDPSGRVPLQDLWADHLEWLPTAKARWAKRKDFMAALRAGGHPIGLWKDGRLWVGGLLLVSNAKWTETDGQLVPAVA